MYKKHSYFILFIMSNDLFIHLEVHLIFVYKYAKLYFFNYLITSSVNNGIWIL